MTKYIVVKRNMKKIAVGKIALGFVFSLLFVLIFAGLQTVEMAKANPFFPSGSYSEEPTIPLISVNLPQQRLSYGSDIDVWLDFTLTVPMTSWYRSDGSKIGTTFGSITSVSYYLDGEERSITANKTYHEYQYFQVSLGAFTYGLHTIKIEVNGSAYTKTTITNDLYAGSTPSFIESVPTKPVSNSAEINFFINNGFNINGSSSNSTASPIPSSMPTSPVNQQTPAHSTNPSPSPSPSPSPTPTTSHYGPYSNVNPASFDLTIYSPDNQAVYADIMLLKFNITWIDFVDFPFPVGPPPKGDYAYSIDDGPRIAIESNQSASDQLYILPAGNFTINPTFSNSVDISSLENGYHKIVIIVGLYRHSDYYYINQTSFPIMFLVQNPSPSPSPSPSPTIPEYPTWIILSILSIIALLAIVVTEKKKKGKMFNY